MTLYEIDQRILALLDPETGELLDFDEFQKLHMDRAEKIENMVLWYKDLLAQAKAIKEEIDRLKERQKASERRAANLLGYINLALNGEKFSTPRCTVSYRASKALEVNDAPAAVRWLDENGHPNLVTYGEPKLDKRAISSLVKLGARIPGVTLVERKSTQIK